MKGYYNPMPILIPLIMRESMRNSAPITDVPKFAIVVLAVLFIVVIVLFIGLLIEVIKDWFGW